MPADESSSGSAPDRDDGPEPGGAAAPEPAWVARAEREVRRTRRSRALTAVTVAVLALVVAVAVGVGPFRRHPPAVADVPVEMATSPIGCAPGFRITAVLPPDSYPAGSAVDLAGTRTPHRWGSVDGGIVLVAAATVSDEERARWEGPGTVRVWATPGSGGYIPSVGDLVNRDGDMLEVHLGWGDIC